LGWRRLLLIGPPEDRLAERIQAQEPALEIEQRSAREVRPEDLARAEMLLTFVLPEAAPEQLEHLRWIQSTGAGVDRIVNHPGLFADTLVTRVVGVFGERMAEYVLSRALFLTQDLPGLIRDQAKRRWRPFAPRRLSGLRTVVAGVGEIGGEIARALAAKGAEVIGVNTSGQPVEGLARVEPAARLDELLPGCDLLVLVLPSTPATRRLIDRRRLSLLPQGAWLINVGRGALLDEAALIASLEAGRLGAACLDVFEQEPLPEESPLWSLPNVLISPHLAGLTTPEEAAGAFIENFRRLEEGRQPLGLVDRRSGY